MAKVAITEQYLKDIADAIRTRKGAIGNIATPNMANGILNIAGGTGAFKVNSIEAIANLEDMQEGDYCVVDNIDTYLLYQYNNNAWGDVTDEILYPSINVAPTTNNQTVEIPEGYKGLNVVNIDAVTSAIDANITPANIRLGTSILGVDGNCEPDKPDQSKTVTPTTTNQTVYADTGYELGSVEVEGVTASIDQNIISANIKKQTTILGVNGTYTTNAYKVSNVEEMNAITDMEHEDYCIIKGIPEYVIPDGDIVFTKFTGNGADVINGSYDNYLWIFVENYTGKALSNSNDSYYGSPEGKVSLDSITITNNTITVTKTNNHVILLSRDENGLQLKYISNNKLLRLYRKNDYLVWADNDGTYNPLYLTELTRNNSTNNFTVKFVNNNYPYLVRERDSGFDYGKLGSTSVQWRLFYARLETTTVDHLVYQYREGTGWVDVTEQILYPQTTITPTTSSQTARIPDGYRGLKNVTVNAIQTETKSITPSISTQIVLPASGKYLSQVAVQAVTSNIDSNIQAEYIKEGISILGVLGEYQGAATGAYRTETVSEMNALVGMESGDYCVVVSDESPEGLPDTYTAVKYLESTEGQYINTGIVPSMDLKFELDYQFLGPYASTESNTVGCGEFTDTTRFAIEYNPKSEEPNFVFGIGPKYKFYPKDLNRHMFVIDLYGRELKVDNTTVPLSDTTTLETQYSFTLFGRHGNNGKYPLYYYCGPSRFYKLKVYNQGTLTHYYVPCIRNSDSTPGVYDIVNDVFLTNQGTGSLIPGTQILSIAYKIYQYNGTTWVDKTDTILTDTAVNPSTYNTQVPIPQGYSGLKHVTVNAVTNSIDANIQASNIKKDVTILGVTGTLEASSQELEEADEIVSNILNGYGGSEE